MPSPKTMASAFYNVIIFDTTALKTFIKNNTLSLSGILIFFLIQNPVFPKPANTFKHPAFATDSITVYIFLLETCPICQSITIEMKNVYEKFKSKGITFVGVFPNLELSDEASIKKFGKKYNLPFELKPDEKQKLMNQFSATITPEIFVVRNADNTVLYKGRIDNGFEGLGKRRQVITEHYLYSALENILLNKPIHPTETKPVGCFISK